MSGNSNMSKRYAAEFRRDAIALVRSSPHRNVTEIARELSVSPEGLRGWVHAWLAARPDAAERQRAEDELAVQIRLIHVKSRGACGVPRVHAELRRKGHAINRKRVERIMRERDIRGITRRRRRHLTTQGATSGNR